jgi:hypothetical protein
MAHISLRPELGLESLLCSGPSPQFTQTGHHQVCERQSFRIRELKPETHRFAASAAGLSLSSGLLGVVRDNQRFSVLSPFVDVGDWRVGVPTRTALINYFTNLPPDFPGQIATLVDVIPTVFIIDR